MSPPDGQVPISALSLIVDGLKRVEESITRLAVELHDQLGRLPNDYVPRREVDRRFDEHTMDIGELRARIAERWALGESEVDKLRTEIRQVEAEREADEQQRRKDRQWAIGVAITVAIALLGLYARR